MIAIVLGAAIWSGTMFAQGNDQILSALDWILHDHDMLRDLTLNGLRSQADDIGKAETDGAALPRDRCQSAPAASSMPSRISYALTSDQACCLGVSAKTSSTVGYSPPDQTLIEAYVAASRWAMTLAKRNRSAR